jgi:hypothetical protein
MEIFYYILNMVDIYLSFMLFKCYFSEKKWVNSLTLSLINVAITLVRVVINEWALSGLLNFLYSIAASLLLCLLCFEAPIKIKVIYTSFYSFLWVCLDTVIPVGLSMLIRVSIADMMAENVLKDFVFFFFLSLFFCSYLRKRGIRLFLKKKENCKQYRRSFR